MIRGLSWLLGCRSHTDDAKVSDDSESVHSNERTCLNWIVEYKPNWDGHHAFSISCGEDNQIFSEVIDPRKGRRFETVTPDGRRIHIAIPNRDGLAHEHGYESSDDKPARRFFPIHKLILLRVTNSPIANRRRIRRVRWRRRCGSSRFCHRRFGLAPSHHLRTRV